MWGVDLTIQPGETRSKRDGYSPSVWRIASASVLNLNGFWRKGLELCRSS